jgi:hypothetical protein
MVVIRSPIVLLNFVLEPRPSTSAESRSTCTNHEGSPLGERILSPRFSIHPCRLIVIGALRSDLSVTQQTGSQNCRMVRCTPGDRIEEPQNDSSIGTE